jgi:transcriptional regulator with XRE-family HTH domain
MSVPERFKWFRVNVLKMTQQELATTLDVAQSAVGNWETGRNQPTAAGLWELIKRHDLNPGWLFDGTGAATSTRSNTPAQVSGNIRWDIGAIDIPAEKFAKCQAAMLRIASDIEDLKKLITHS